MVGSLRTWMLAAALVAPAASFGQTDIALELGVRTGYSLPFGTAVSQGTSGVSVDMKDVFSSRAPLWVDASLRFSPSLSLGAYLQYGFATPASGATTGCGVGGTACSGHDVVIGLAAAYHLLPDSLVDPWLGLGAGYETSSLSSTSGTQAASTLSSLSGWQLVNLEAGVDLKPMSQLGLGAFVSLSADQLSASAVTGGGSGTHAWLTLGVRGYYDLKL